MEKNARRVLLKALETELEDINKCLSKKSNSHHIEDNACFFIMKKMDAKVLRKQIDRDDYYYVCYKKKHGNVNHRALDKIIPLIVDELRYKFNERAVKAKCFEYSNQGQKCKNRIEKAKIFNS